MKAALKQVPFLEPLDDAQLDQLIQQGKQLSLPAGSALFEQGDRGKCLYVVLSGSVRLYLQEGEGHTADLGVLEMGACFGEMALIDRRPRSASAVVLTDCELFVLEREAFLDLLATTPELTCQLLVDLTRRIRIADERYYALVQSSKNHSS